MQPNNIGNYFNEFDSLYYNYKKFIINKINEFCNQIEYSDINDFMNNSDITVLKSR